MILGEVSGPVLRITGGMTFAGFGVAGFAAFAACLHGPRTVIREVARAVLATELAGARRPLPVFGEVAGITRMSFLSHLLPHSFSVKSTLTIGVNRWIPRDSNERAAMGFWGLFKTPGVLT